MDAKKERDEEIEITPETLEAGLTAYDNWYGSPKGDTGPISEMVADVFRVMARTRKIPVLHTPPLILGKDHLGP